MICFPFMILQVGRYRDHHNALLRYQKMHVEGHGNPRSACLVRDATRLRWAYLRVALEEHGAAAAEDRAALRRRLERLGYSCPRRVSDLSVDLLAVAVSLVDASAPCPPIFVECVNGSRFLHCPYPTATDVAAVLALPDQPWTGSWVR